MSLEQAMTEYAEALREHTAVLKQCLEHGVQFIGTAAAAPVVTNNTTAAAAETPAKGKPGRKPKPKPEEKEEADDFGGDGDGDADGDDFGDEPAAAAKTYTADEIKTLLMAVKDKKGADAARGILSDIGVKTIASIPEAQYGKVVELAAKQGVKL